MSVIDEIAAERRRQIEAEGWSAAHDDTHDRGEIAMAAATYAWAGALPPWKREILDHRDNDDRTGWFLIATFKRLWPWADEWWKPTDNRRRDLVKAAALIVAEIERLDRASERSK